ncbi:MAG: hypothetical protein PHU21_08415 [Elusimicrobia bacterium]|nr:hypothetical protein [Elusimicrobiota bacterium]
MRPAALSAALLLLLAPGLAAKEDEEPVECPQGTFRVHTDNPYQPFRCVAKDERRKGGLTPAVGPRGFSARPRCPPGSRPMPTPGSLQAYRCVMSSRTAAEPDLTPDLDTRGRTRSWGTQPAPARKGAAGSLPSEHQRLTGRSYARYAVSSEFSFDYPKDWHLTEAWSDEPPTIYVVRETGGGKQVTMTVTAVEPGQAGYQSVELAIIKEREWQEAQLDPKEGRVAGLPARFATVPGSSRSAYVDRGGGSYLILNYSAPGDLFEFYLPAFQRLLKSLRLKPR